MSDFIRRVVIAVLVASFFTVVAAAGGFYTLDNIIADKAYQERSVASADIVLIEINQQALEDLGPISDWTRDIYAQLIEVLNADEATAPAVIGFDVLFASETIEASDAALVEVAASYDNVVFGSAAEFGNSLVLGDDGEYTLDTFSVTAYDSPFAALAAVAAQAHLNVMLDDDGILRHQLLSFTEPDSGQVIYSFASVIAQKYADYYGLGTLELPTTNSQGYWYLSFTGEPGDYSESIALSSVLDGTIPASYFAGKIVLVGPYAAGLQDSYFTSINHASPMYGVEIHANAIQAILSADYKVEVDDNPQLWALFILTFAATLFFYKRKMLPSIIAFVLVAVAAVVVPLQAYSHGYVLHLIWLPVALGCIFIGSVAVNYVVSAKEKSQVTNTFKKYLEPTVVNELLKSGSYNEIGVGGKTVDIAVLFVDIRGFTSMSEKLEPDQVVEILNSYLSLIAECIFHHKGTLDKFIGDAAMAFWGAPLPQEDYLMLALRAAMEMKERSADLSEELQAKYGRTVAFGIGVHVGKALVGNIGSANRLDYTAIGDTVNTASRLESIAPKETIYVSQEVVGRMGERISVQQLAERISLKGKQEPVVVYELKSLEG